MLFSEDPGVAVKPIILHPIFLLIIYLAIKL